MDPMTPSAIRLAPEQITDFPLFNEVQLEVAKYFQGQSTPDLIEVPLVALEELLTKLFAHLHDQLQYQPESVLMMRATQIIYGNFAVLQAEFPILRRCLQDYNQQGCQDHLLQARLMLVGLTATMAELRAEEESRPQFCDIPLFNDACRVALMVIQRKLAAELLRTRLDQAWELLDSLEKIIQGNFEPAPAEGAEPGPLNQGLRQLELGLESLEDIYEALPASSREAMEDAMELLGNGCAVLVDYYLKLKEPQADPAQETQACFRCSQENPRGSVRCSRCNALFPVTAENGASSSINFDETGRSREWPNFVARVVNEVEAYRARRSTGESAKKEIGDLQNRLRNGLTKMGDLEMVEEEGASPHELEKVGAFFDRLATSVEKAVEGLEAMRVAIDKSDPVGVDRDLELVLGQVEQLLDLQKQIGGLLDAQPDS